MWARIGIYELFARRGKQRRWVDGWVALLGGGGMGERVGERMGG